MALLVGELYALLLLEKKAFMTGLKEAEAGAAASSSKIGASIMGIGKVAALGLAALVIGLGAFGAASIGAAMDFQKGMANIQTLIGRGSEVDARIHELGDAVKQVSIETGKSLSDLQRGLYDIIGTFTDTADSAGWLELAAKAAAAGLASTHDAILLLGSVTKSYGDTSLEAAKKAADLVFETANLGVTTFPEMAAAMGKVLPVAAALKVSQEELFGAMATLTGVTGDTSQVVTQLYSIMRAFIKPNMLMKEAIKETGFESGMAMIKQLGLAGAMKLIGGTSTIAAKGIGAVYGRAEALTAVLALSGNQAQDWVWKTEAMRQAAGRTDRAFEIQQKTVSAMVDRIGAALGVLAIAIGDKLLPAFGSLLSWVEQNMPDIADVVLGAVDSIITGFTIIGKAAMWVVDRLATAWSILGDLGMQGPLIQATLVVIAAGFVALGVAAGGAAIAVIAATWPILAVIVAVALGIKGLSLVFDYFGIKVGDVFAWLGKTAKDFVQAFLSVVGSIVNIISMIPGPLQDTANQWKATLDSMHDDVGRWGTDTSTAAMHAGEDVADQFGEGMRGRLADSMASGGAGAYDALKAAGANGGAAWLQGLGDSLKGEGVTLTKKELADLGITMDQALAAGIQVEAEAPLNAAKSLVEQLGFTLNAVVKAAKTSGGQAMAQMATDIAAHRKEPLDQFDTLVQMMKTSLSPMKEAAKLAGNLASKALAQGLKDSRPDVRAQAEAVVKETAEHLGEIAGHGGKAGKAAMHALDKGIRSKIPAVRDASKAAKAAAVKQLQAAKKPAHDAGVTAAKAFGNALEDNISNLTVVVDITAHAAAKFGPGYASGAWRIKKDQLAFIHQGEMVVPAAAANRIREAATAPNGYSQLEGAAGGGTGGGITQHITVPVQGLIKAKDPFELANRVRRIADFGVLTAKDAARVGAW